MRRQAISILVLVATLVVAAGGRSAPPEQPPAATPARGKIEPGGRLPIETIHFPRRETKDPETGRRWLQLTSGNEFCYPLYYFGPTVTADGGTLAFYRYVNDEVQNWKLDIASGDAVRLTAATTPNCMWRFWDEKRPAHGVREQLSAFSPGSEELLYFDGNVLHAVHVRTLADRAVYTLSGKRVPCGLPGASPDGKHFAFVHADRHWWDEATQHGPPPRHEARGVHLDVVDLATGACRTLLVINSWLTHVNFYDNQRIIFCHHPTEESVLMTDLRGGWYTHLRTQGLDGSKVQHYQPTRRGLMYESSNRRPLGSIGLCDPDSHVFQDYRTSYPIHHVGRDTEGKFWFGDCVRNDGKSGSFLAWLPSVQADKVNEFRVLTRSFGTYAHGQRGHLHPVLMPDRRHILFTGPDAETRTNHIFLLDISDLANTETKIQGREK